MYQASLLTDVNDVMGEQSDQFDTHIPLSGGRLVDLQVSGHILKNKTQRGEYIRLRPIPHENSWKQWLCLAREETLHTNYAV